MADDIKIGGDGNIIVMSHDEAVRYIHHQMQMEILACIDIKIAEERKPEFGMPLPGIMHTISFEVPL